MNIIQTDLNDNPLYVRLRRTTITVTLRCTLRCRLCAIDIPNYTTELPHYTSAEIAKELDSYFKLVDYVEWLQYSGGEPFLNLELDKMVEKAMEYSNQFDKLMIFANGTILPSENMMKAFIKYKDKIVFFLSHYGGLSSKAEEMVSLFEENGLNYEIKKYYGDDQHCGGWIDYGTWEKRGSTEEELKEIFKSCGMTTMRFSVLQDGILCLCRRSWRGRDLGVVPNNNVDLLNIFDQELSIEEKKRKILDMLKLEYIEACNHCSGYYTSNNKTKRYPAAEQVIGGIRNE